MAVCENRKRSAAFLASILLLLTLSDIHVSGFHSAAKNRCGLIAQRPANSQVTPSWGRTTQAPVSIANGGVGMSLWRRNTDSDARLSETVETSGEAFNSQTKRRKVANFFQKLARKSKPSLSLLATFSLAMVGRNTNTPLLGVQPAHAGTFGNIVGSAKQRDAYQSTVAETEKVTTNSASKVAGVAATAVAGAGLGRYVFVKKEDEQGQEDETSAALESKEEQYNSIMGTENSTDEVDSSPTSVVDKKKAAKIIIEKAEEAQKNAAALAAAEKAAFEVAAKIAKEEVSAVNIPSEEKKTAEENAAEESAAKLLEESRIAEEARLAEEAKIAEEAKAAAEEARIAEEAKAAEETRIAEEAKAAEEARIAEEAKTAEQAKAAEEARLAEEAKAGEQAEAAQEARLAELAKEAAKNTEEKLKQSVNVMKSEKVSSGASEIAAARKQPKSASEERELTERYGAMNPEDRAFNILVNLGMVEITPSPDDPQYDGSLDDEFCAENTFL